MKPYRLILLFAAIAGLSGVVMAALGSHMVSGLDQPEAYRSWQAASVMHLVHAAALLALSAYARGNYSRLTGLSAAAIVLGIILFSGSIYLDHASGIRGATRVAPAGGMLLMAGWLLLGLSAFKRKR